MAGVAADQLPGYLDEFMWRQRHPDRAHHMERILEAIAQMHPTQWRGLTKQVLLESEMEEKLYIWSGTQRKRVLLESEIEE